MNMQAATPLNRDGDYLSESGAYALAAAIRGYWTRRGFSPKIWVSKVLSAQSPTDGERVIFTVKSDMLNGKPV